MNAFGTLVLWLWVPVALLAYARMRPALATASTLLAASLLLPCGSIDLPGLPVLSKDSIAGLACLLGCLLFAPDALRRARAGRGPELLVGLALVGGVFTYLTNRDPLVFGPKLVSGTRFTDLFVPDVVLIWGAPFLAGRALFRDGRAARLLLASLVVAALLYSPLILLELRLSPQLHRWVYGYHQHAFFQTIRGSGYRPMVFMPHGLVLTLFLALAVMAALTLARARTRVLGAPAGAVGLGLGALLVLCRSLGPTLYAATSAPLIALASPRRQMLAAAALSTLVLAYPMLRTTDLVPADALIERAEGAFGSERAASLHARLVNEKAVLERAKERIWFGWSGWGRPMIWDPETGENRTTFDGYWAIVLGEGGVVRFVAIFGLILYPVFAAWRRFGRIPAAYDRVLVAGLALIVAVRAFNLIPNTAVDPFLTLFSGALCGVVEGCTTRAPGARRATASAARVRP